MATPKQKAAAQREVRAMVEREVTPVIQAQMGPKTPVEEALVKAIYAPDERLAPA